MIVGIKAEWGGTKVTKRKMRLSRGAIKIKNDQQ